ncbi:MAG: DUF4286 family protein [Bacteroidota bacterium]|nr:DUF4286 family protein [Bacteroidota bacterium]MDP4218665.1 DUF4286 family protein [Bacteroidota bacterium]MDP4247872.1 DUF4286 family protein [Bacteroidota bacterium]MDP4254985.1 DUF4286 family protein [Bacteroidota bacterium]MDP4258641.1 DUF4286 family protein [Bacteroidota bacterium]
MIVCNFTIKVQDRLADQWLDWALREHIPAILSTGLFEGYRIHRLLDQDESEGPTFVLQLHASSLDEYQHYRERFAPALQQDALNKWGAGFIAFRTVMELISPPG